jgi:hypothetical protein
MPSRALVVDAGILVRAVLGKGEREVFEAFAGAVTFFVPESAYTEPKNTWQHWSSSAVVIRKSRSRCCTPWGA